MRAKAHNELIALHRRKRPRYVRFPSLGHLHPWKTVAAWDNDLKKWCARTRPGFVNGLDPLVPGVSVPNEKYDSLKDTADKKERAASLCDGAAMPLHAFRDGFDGMSAGAKLYFKERGAVPPTSNLGVVQRGEGIAITQTGVDAVPAAWRAVRAVDLYVTVARPSLRGTVDIVDATGITGQIAQYGATYDTQSLDLYGTRSRFQQAPTFPAKGADPTAMDILKGVPGDDGEDRVPVCTVFLLSPEQKPDAASGLVLDGTWTAHVQHHLFWNVLYAAKYEPPKVAPAPIRLTTGLWLADTIGNQILAPLNDLSNRILSAYQTRSPEGQFFTV